MKPLEETDSSGASRGGTTFVLSPLPEPRAIIRSLIMPPSSGARWTAGQDSVVRLFARGTHALTAGIDAVLRKTKASALTLWVPGYFCYPVLSLVCQLPVRLRFYPVLEDLSPDWDHIDPSAIAADQAQAFLLVHFFGFPGPASQARAFCDRHRMVLIEDAVHVLLPESVPPVGDMRILSPHKVLAVPSVGILVSSPEWATSLADVPTEPEWQASLTWLAKRLVQAAAMRLHVPWHRLKRNALGTVTPPAERGPLGKENGFALKLLSSMEREVPRFAEMRTNNYRRLVQQLATVPGVRPLFPTVPDGVCPMALPLLAPGGGGILVRRLRQAGVAAGQFDEIPRELSTQPGPHDMAMKFYEQLVWVPTHQSLSSRQIDEIGGRVAAAAPPAPEFISGSIE